MYNIATGAAADRETTLFLLPFQEIGASAKEKNCIRMHKRSSQF